MKTATDLSQPQQDSREVQLLSNEQELHKDVANTQHAACQQKLLLRIERTNLWSFRGGVRVDKTSSCRVLYRKLPLGRLSKSEKEKLILEILLRS